MANASPSLRDLQHFLVDLRTQRKRLAALSNATGTAASDALAAAIDEVSERLVVADEELRVQSEQIARSAERLDELVSAYEALFADAPIGYVHTDANGVIVRLNRAARRALGLPADRRQSWVIANLFAPEDHRTIRQIITAHRSGRPNRSAPVEVSLARPDGMVVPVFLTVRASYLSDVTLHWEIREREAREADHPAPSADTAAPGRPVDAALALAQTATDLDRIENADEAVQAVAELAVRCVPHCTGAAVMVRRGDKLRHAAASCPTMRALDQAQLDVREGPALSAAQTGAPVAAPDLSADRRWPALGRRPEAAKVPSVMSFPLEARRGLVGVVTLEVDSAPDMDETTSIGTAYATHAAIALTRAELEGNLRIGMQTREQIGRAVGVVMAQQRLSATAAFDLLAYVSQCTHTKLRDVAEWVCETGDDPVKLVTARPQN